MTALTKLLFALTLTVSFCFAIDSKERAAAGVEMMVRHELADPDLDVEVTFDANSVQLLDHIAPPFALSGPDPRPVNYQSDFKLLLKVADGRVFSIGGAYKCFKYFQVAIKKIASGSLIKKGQLKAIKVEYSKKQDVLTDKDNVIGMEVLREIQPGVPIALSSFIQPVIIPMGSIVDVLVYGRKVPYKDECITLTPGRLGDIVFCRSLKTQEVYPGRVLHPKRLFVLSGEGLFEPSTQKGSSSRH